MHPLRNDLSTACIFKIVYTVSMQENIWRDWLHRRHITDGIIEDFGVHWGTTPMGEGIVIPIFYENHVFNKYRRDPLSDEKPKYMYDKGSKTALYGWERAKQYNQILVTEGELDCLVAWSANIPAVSSTSGSMTFLPEWAELLKDKEIILCFDNDAAGGEGMVRILGMIPTAKILFLPDRPGVKDISDYVQNGGDLNVLLKTARNFTSMEEIVNDRAERNSTWLSTHFHDAYTKKYQEIPRSRRKAESDDKIIKAKDYPISQLIKIPGSNSICCPFHNEKTPSCHYYERGNNLYCFGACGKGYDAIDVYMKVNGESFKSSVEWLSSH